MMEKTSIKIIIETEDGKDSLKREYGIKGITNIEPKELRSMAVNWLDGIETLDNNPLTGIKEEDILKMKEKLQRLMKKHLEKTFMKN